MVVPEGFRVRGRRWRVEWVHDLRDEENRRCHGITMHGERVVYLDVDLNGRDHAQLERVWAHELLHACMPARGPNRPHTIDSELEEDFVGAVDEALAYLLRDARGGML